MNVKFDLDTLLYIKFEECSDEDLVTFQELLAKWLEKVEDELEYVNGLNDYADDEDDD
jgi:hypothetical protein